MRIARFPCPHSEWVRPGVYFSLRRHPSFSMPVGVDWPAVERVFCRERFQQQIEAACEWFYQRAIEGRGMSPVSEPQEVESKSLGALEKVTKTPTWLK